MRKAVDMCLVTILAVVLAVTLVCAFSALADAYDQKRARNAEAQLRNAVQTYRVGGSYACEVLRDVLREARGMIKAKQRAGEDVRELKRVWSWLNKKYRKGQCGGPGGPDGRSGQGPVIRDNFGRFLPK